MSAQIDKMTPVSMTDAELMDAVAGGTYSSVGWFLTVFGIYASLRPTYPGETIPRPLTSPFH